MDFFRIQICTRPNQLLVNFGGHLNLITDQQGDKDFPTAAVKAFHEKPLKVNLAMLR